LWREGKGKEKKKKNLLQSYPLIGASGRFVRAGFKYRRHQFKITENGVGVTGTLGKGAKLQWTGTQKRTEGHELIKIEDLSAGGKTQKVRDRKTTTVVYERGRKKA